MKRSQPAAVAVAISFALDLLALWMPRTAAAEPAPAGTAYAPDFQPFAETIDTLTEATLVYTFL